MLNKIIATASGLAIFAGFGLIIGSAGSLDLNAISLLQGLLQTLGGLFLIGGGVAGLFATCDIEVDYV